MCVRHSERRAVGAHTSVGQDADHAGDDAAEQAARTLLRHGPDQRVQNSWDPSSGVSGSAALGQPPRLELVQLVGRWRRPVHAEAAGLIQRAGEQAVSARIISPTGPFPGGAWICSLRLFRQTELQHFPPPGSHGRGGGGGESVCEPKDFWKLQDRSTAAWPGQVTGACLRILNLYCHPEKERHAWLI